MTKTDADKAHPVRVSPQRLATRMLESLQTIVQEVSREQDLEKILGLLVQRVRQVLGVDAFSVYLTDHKSRENVLMATDGLRADAVGHVRLGEGEGLIGFAVEQSESINIANAQSHPRFHVVPDCGEEPYHSFLGVPVHHEGKPLGVFAVQQVDARKIRDTDVAFLVTLAAQIAEVIALAEARKSIGAAARRENELDQCFQGVSGVPGVGIGAGVWVYSTTELDSVPNRTPDDPKHEEERFREAINETVGDFVRLSHDLDVELPTEDRGLFEAYAGIAGSSTLIDATVRRIHEGNWAPAALRDSVAEYVSRFERMDDPYLRERGQDIRAIGQQVLSKLMCEAGTPRDYPENTILIGKELSPFDLAEIPRERLMGIVSGHGSALSHLAILAHAMGIPTVMGLGGSVPLDELDGRAMIVDGDHSRLHVDPSASVRREFGRLFEEKRKAAHELEGLRELPAETLDGYRVALLANAGFTGDIAHSKAVGAEGIGLYRTELPFMIGERFPTEEEQRLCYRELLEGFSPRPVTIRTLDIGGDKQLPYLVVQEDNPFLGWRGIRVSLDHPELLLTQLRAMFRASEGLRNLRILFPMISGVAELEEVLHLVERTRERLCEEGVLIHRTDIGVMIEVPSAVYLIDELARRVDFLSIGTNDLAQYLLAVDRNNERVAHLYDPLHPAVLRAVAHVAEAGLRHGKSISVCGEAAGDPLFAFLLLGMGVDTLSLGASDLLGIKKMVRGVAQARSKILVRESLAYEKPEHIRDLLSAEFRACNLGDLLVEE
jgi:phosphotransferase system enzyme I (PtsP)